MMHDTASLDHVCFGVCRPSPQGLFANDGVEESQFMPFTGLCASFGFAVWLYMSQWYWAEVWVMAWGMISGTVVKTNQSLPPSHAHVV